MKNLYFSDNAYAYARWVTFLLLLSLPFTRVLGGLNLVAITALSWCFLVVFWNKELIPKSLIYFSIVAISYFLLSFFQVFPQIWTTLFEFKAIPQQALVTYSMLPIFYLLSAFMIYYLHSKERLKQLLRIVLLFIVFSKCIFAILNGFDSKIFLSVSGLGNESALIILWFGLSISIVEKSMHKWSLIVVFILVSANSQFSQNFAFAFIFLWVFLTPKLAMLTLLGFISSTLLFYAIFIQDPMQVRFIDQNLTVRLVLIKDAIDGFVESNLIGVGFGTESIKNYYHLFRNPTFFNPENHGFIHLAVHNSFATIAYRLGLAGFICFILFMYEIICCIAKMTDGKPVATVFFLCFYIVTFQNPALESYAYMIGVFIMLSSIWAIYIVERDSIK